MFNAVLIAINILIGLILMYLINYVKKRSEINATKADIEILTDKVESVKFEYLRKIEDYKKDLNLKYQLSSTLVESRISSYQLASLIKVIILKRKSKIGNEKELMEDFFTKIPELIITLESQVQLRTILRNEIDQFASYYNEVIDHIEGVKKKGETMYNIDLALIENTIDRIQLKLLEI